MARMSIEEFKKMVEMSNKLNTRPRKRTRPKQIEHDIQVECVRWFGQTYPMYEPYFWATPNGGYRAKRTAIAMKQEGMKAGVPDLQLAYPSKGYHGLFIEMKKSAIGKRGQVIARGKVSDAQQERMQALSDVGYKCVVCYSFDEFVREVRTYLEE